MRKQTYRDYADARAERSPTGINCVNAFFVGGGICAFAEALREYLTTRGTEEQTASLLVSCVLIVLTALLTGLGVFDKLAKRAGAGTLVPITGFANAVASPALDTKSEGLVLGLGVRIFTVAGPVILYGVLASVLYGALRVLCALLL